MTKEQKTGKPLGVITVEGDEHLGFRSYILPDDKTIDRVTDPKFQSAYTDDRFGTGGKHVGRDLNDKKTARPLDEQGVDPYEKDRTVTVKREFMGDEFTNMLAYDAKGKPAFWSHFHKINADGTPKLDAEGKKQPIESPEDLKGQTFKILLANKLPKYLENNELVNGLDVWEGKKPKDVAVRVNARLEEQMKIYAENYTKVTGLKVEFTDKEEEANLTVMSWPKSKPSLGGTLLGVASFPESINTWSSLNGLGNKPGMMFLNNEWCERSSTTDQQVRDLFAHEFGHNMGWCHPHDLARLRMPQSEALLSTLMAYSDTFPDDFKGKEGAGMGPIDYSFRKYWPDAPAINAGEGKVYDLQEHLDASFAKNARTTAVSKNRGLLPTAVIVDAGKGTELHGTKGDDFIDTNPGYVSLVTIPPVASNIAQLPAGAKRSPKKTSAADVAAHVTTEPHDDTPASPEGQNPAVPTPKPVPAPQPPRSPGRMKVLLSEGHIAVVKTLTGNNIIIASKTGDQRIEPGNGKNEIRFYEQSIGGHKTIHSEGKDTLVLSSNILLADGKIHATRDENGNTVIKGKEGSITLTGKGLDTIRVIDNLGKTLFEENVKDLTAEQLQSDVIAPASRKAQQTRMFSRPGVPGPIAGGYAGQEDERRRTGTDRAR